MKVEIIEFYPETKKENYIKGTMHVYLIDEKIDLRGWMVIKNKNTWIFHFPSKIGKDPETGKLVRYPVFGYNDPQKSKCLYDEVRQKGKKYIEENFFNKG